MSLLHPLDPSPFGMGVYPSHRTTGDATERAVRLAREIGVRWTRDEIGWHGLQPEKGTWRWERFDRAVNITREHGIEILGLLCYGTPWAVKHATADGRPDVLSLPDLEAWKDYVSAAVERFRDRVHVWELWNEPNSHTFWHPGPDPKEYARLLIAGSEAAKKADPTCWVCGCNTGDVDPAFHRAVFNEGGWDHLDIIGVHPYRPPHTPEHTDMLGDLLQIAELSAAHGRVKPIWLTEIGISTFGGIDGATEWWASALLLRFYLEAWSSRLVEKVFWYDFRDDGDDLSEEQQNFGIVRRDWSPKLAFHAYRLMATTLDGFVPDGMHKVGNDLRVLRFRRGEEERLAVWSVGKNMRRPVPAPRIGDEPAPRARLLGLGEPRRPSREPVVLDAPGGWVRVDLNACPFFLAPER